MKFLVIARSDRHARCQLGLPLPERRRVRASSRSSSATAIARPGRHRIPAVESDADRAPWPLPVSGAASTREPKPSSPPPQGLRPGYRRRFLLGVADPQRPPRGLLKRVAQRRQSVRRVHAGTLSGGRFLDMDPQVRRGLRRSTSPAPVTTKEPTESKGTPVPGWLPGVRKACADFTRACHRRKLTSTVNQQRVQQM